VEGWLAVEVLVSVEVCHGGSVSRAVRGLKYQGLDVLELGIYAMFSPGNNRERLMRYFGERWCWLRAGSHWNRLTIRL